MRRCPNGTRRKNGTCVAKTKSTKSTRCKKGARRKNGECIQGVSPFIQQYETKFERF